MLTFKAVTIIVAAAVVSGLPTTKSRLRILGGSETTIEQHPYQVAIETEGETLVCGGSILSAKIILTAVHPFLSSDYPEEINYLARIGSTYREAKGKLYPFSSEQLVFHPNFGEEHPFDYDVAIIKLEETIKFSPTAEPVPLIRMGEETEDGTTLILTGYGFTTLNGQRPNKLQVATLIKQNQEACSSFENVINDRMLCVGKGIPTPFHGDSGGPLINKQRQLVGTVSWGNRKPSKTDPAVFTNLAHPKIYKFIDQYITS